MLNDVTVINIREYLSDNNELGEEQLKAVLSEFFCGKNVDVQRFLTEHSIEFTKKNQSVTYLVFANEDAELIGYYTIAIKPISVDANIISSKRLRRRIERVSKLDEESGTYSLSAFLIAQLGKNYANHANERLTGEQLIQDAINTIKELQYMAGGMVVFVEAEDHEKLIRFYEDNGFMRFSIRESHSREGVETTLVQLLKVL